MADPAFRSQQWEGRYAPHIAPVNRFVDQLREREWAPYVAPIHGGVDARVLSILRDPGPKTRDGEGSGFLSTENDDPTAERQGQLLATVGLDAADILPWNAYPWYINRAPRAAELELGVKPILDLIDMLPKLRAVLLQGGSAKDSWRRVLKRAPRPVEERGVEVIATYHPGRSALWHPDPEVRARRVEHQLEAFRLLGQRLREPE